MLRKNANDEYIISDMIITSLLPAGALHLLLNSDRFLVFGYVFGYIGTDMVIHTDMVIQTVTKTLCANISDTTDHTTYTTSNYTTDYTSDYITKQSPIAVSTTITDITHLHDFRRETHDYHFDHNLHESYRHNTNEHRF